MTIGGARHRALVRILMHALSTETHAYARANYTRGTGSPVEERAASAIASSSSNSSRGTSARSDRTAPSRQRRDRYGEDQAECRESREIAHAICNGITGRSRRPLSRSNSGPFARLIEAAEGAFSLAGALFRSTVCRRD